eukprot:gene1761-2066_t
MPDEASAVTSSGPGVVGPAVSGPTVVGPAVSGAFAQRPAVVAPAVVDPVVSGPAVVVPAVSGPTVVGPAGSGAFAQRPAVVAPAVVGPVVSGPAVVVPAVSGPAVQRPAVVDPVVALPPTQSVLARVKAMESSSGRSVPPLVRSSSRSNLNSPGSPSLPAPTRLSLPSRLSRGASLREDTSPGHTAAGTPSTPGDWHVVSPSDLDSSPGSEVGASRRSLSLARVGVAGASRSKTGTEESPEGVSPPSPVG